MIPHKRLDAPVCAAGEEILAGNGQDGLGLCHETIVRNDEFLMTNDETTAGNGDQETTETTATGRRFR